MSPHAEQLTALLTAELTTLETLEQTLNAEYEALVSNDVEALETATTAKNNAIGTHRAQQEQRLQWMQALGLPPSSSLGELVSHCGNDPAATRLQDQLAGLATQCQKNNRRNGGLILRLQDRTRGALDILRREEGATDLYSLSGSREHHSDSRTLGKA